MASVFSQALICLFWGLLTFIVSAEPPSLLQATYKLHQVDVSNIPPKARGMYQKSGLLDDSRSYTYSYTVAEFELAFDQPLYLSGSPILDVDYFVSLSAAHRQIYYGLTRLTCQAPGQKKVVIGSTPPLPVHMAKLVVGHKREEKMEEEEDPHTLSQELKDWWYYKTHHHAPPAPKFKNGTNLTESWQQSHFRNFSTHGFSFTQDNITREEPVLNDEVLADLDPKWEQHLRHPRMLFPLSSARTSELAWLLALKANHPYNEAQSSYLANNRLSFALLLTSRLTYMSSEGIMESGGEWEYFPLSLLPHCNISVLETPVNATDLWEENPDADINTVSDLKWTLARDQTGQPYDRMWPPRPLSNRQGEVIHGSFPVSPSPLLIDHQNILQQHTTEMSFLQERTTEQANARVKFLSMLIQPILDQFMGLFAQRVGGTLAATVGGPDASMIVGFVVGGEAPGMLWYMTEPYYSLAKALLDPIVDPMIEGMGMGLEPPVAGPPSIPAPPFAMPTAMPAAPVAMPMPMFRESEDLELKALAKGRVSMMPSAQEYWNGIRKKQAKHASDLLRFKQGEGPEPTSLQEQMAGDKLYQGQDYKWRSDMVAAILPGHDTVLPKYYEEPEENNPWDWINSWKLDYDPYPASSYTAFLEENSKIGVIADSSASDKAKALARARIRTRFMQRLKLYSKDKSKEKIEAKLNTRVGVAISTSDTTTTITADMSSELSIEIKKPNKDAKEELFPEWFNKLVNDHTRKEKAKLDREKAIYNSPRFQEIMAPEAKGGTQKGGTPKPSDALGELTKAVITALSHGLTEELTIKITELYVEEGVPDLFKDVKEAADQTEKFQKEMGPKIGKAVRQGLDVTLPITVPKLLERLLPVTLMKNLAGVVARSLIRSVTHALAPTLHFTLRDASYAEPVCYYCHYVDTRYCHLCKGQRGTLEQETTLLQYLDYYCDMYTDHYSTELTGA